MKVSILKLGLLLGLLITLDFSTGKKAFGQEDPSRDDSFLKKTWEAVKGHRPQDAFLLGMYGLHLDGTGVIGNGNNNEQHHLIGIQLYGLNAGTFINSHRDRTYFAGLGRTVYAKPYGNKIRLDIGYQMGLLYGYGNHLKNVGGISGYIIPMIGVTWKRLGFDIGLVPVGIITGNFRIDIEGRWKKQESTMEK